MNPPEQTTFNTQSECARPAAQQRDGRCWVFPGVRIMRMFQHPVRDALRFGGCAFAARPALVAIVFLLLQWSALASSLRHYGERVWQTDDGLPHNSVLVIAQTTDGYIWVGTLQGLARFDGLRFVNVDSPAEFNLKRHD